MKKIISVLTLVAVLVAMSSFSALAVGSLTMSSTAVDNKAVAGDEFIVSVTNDTTNGMAGLGFKIAFDVNDIELGTSASADQAAIDYADFIGTPDFPTLNDVCLAINGYAAHVDDEYYAAYNAFTTAQKFDSANMGAYEEKGGKGYVAFSVAGEKAKNALNKVDNKVFGGLVLKVKTAEKKQTTITIEEATYANASLVDTPCSVVNTITLDLNGYGEATASAYNVTYAGNNVVWGNTPATTATTVDAEKEVVFTVEPAFGYKIVAVTGVDTVLPEGGEMTAKVAADNTVINVTVVEKTDAAITYETAVYDANYGWVVFGKVPATTATYGIALDGVNYAGANAVNGAFGVGFKGLTAGSYTAAAYAGESVATTTATITVAE